MITDPTLVEKLRARGHDVTTVSEALGDTGATPPVTLVSPPKLDGQPEFPPVGIYFGMPEDVYHSIHACSASGIKKLSTSSMDYWACSPLNHEREDDGDSVAKMMGRAYHCRICEGQDAFLERYAVALDKEDFTNLIVTTADLREAINKLDAKPKGTAKEPLIEQLLDLDPTAKVWDREVAAHEAANAGKTLITPKLYRRIEIAAAMIAGDPQLKAAFDGGHAEVSVFWHDPKTGAPMKARFDYLKMNHLVDLKSFANMMGKPVQRAIDMAISNQKYFIPVVVYLEAIAAAKAMIKDKRGGAVFRYSANADGSDPMFVTTEAGPLLRWCWDWAHQPEPEVLFVFQQTGVAPVTRGRIMPKSSTYEVTRYAVQALKAKWVQCATTYGVVPWLDIEPVVATEDESLTWAATDFGDNT